MICNKFFILLFPVLIFLAGCKKKSVNAETDPAAAKEPSLPKNFNWSASGILVNPKADADHQILSVKDPTVVFYENKWHIFATTCNQDGHWNMIYFNFSDWSQADNAKQYYLEDYNLAGYHCAPQVFYFKPHGYWYLIYQSQHPQYSVTRDLTNPSSWTKPKNLASFDLPGSPPIDYWIICDSLNCYLFFTGDDGKFYRSGTSINSFPIGLNSAVTVLEHDRDILFEGSATYKIKGLNLYLTIIEGLSRSYNAWTAARLDGEWTPLQNANRLLNSDKPFAGSNNVTFADGIKWTNHISHGELLRDGYDQTMTIDPSNLRMLFQGMDPEFHGEYYASPYRLGLLTHLD
jgi:hypothetical protein